MYEKLLWIEYTNVQMMCITKIIFFKFVYLYLLCLRFIMRILAFHDKNKF